MNSLPSKAKKARVQPYSLKVTYASLEGGKIKNPTRQIYVLINDETVNVDYIKKQCEEELKINNIVLATANGLLLEDSAGTRGLCISLHYNHYCISSFSSGYVDFLVAISYICFHVCAGSQVL